MLSEQNEIKLIELFKACSKCKIPKLLNKFRENKTGRFGVHSICRVCESLYSKAYRIANKEKVSICTKLYDKTYRLKNKDKIKIRNQIYYKNNKERMNIQQKAWARANPEKVRKYSKKTDQKNKEKVKARRKAYYLKNKDKIKARNEAYRKLHRKQINIRFATYRKQRYKTDPMFRLNCSISSLVRYSLKRGKNGTPKWDILPFTLESLKKHLKKQFAEGMSWDNYGKNGWWIDHKVPVSVFNFTKPEHQDFKKCWALKNLQPTIVIDVIWGYL